MAPTHHPPNRMQSEKLPHQNSCTLASTFLRRKEEHEAKLALVQISYLLPEADMAGDAVVLGRRHLDLGDDGQHCAPRRRGRGRGDGR